MYLPSLPKFITLTFSILTATTYAVSCTSSSDTAGTPYATDSYWKSAMTDCLQTALNNSNWNGDVCNGYGFFKGHSGSYSAYNCFSDAASDLETLISQGAESVQCDNSHQGFLWVTLKCWIGWNEPESSTGSFVTNKPNT
ncbi:MAG: hypothetical protein M1827_006681 [Pycnora praestabilis]|nr:MAG: hypothetical protein M1827_006681 [Pycnora praestabilis]